MNLELLERTLHENNIWIGSNSKNYICKCFYCGDHPNPKKHGHLWISRDPTKPFTNCFLCHRTPLIPQLIFDLTADYNLSESIFPRSDIGKLFDGRSILKKNTSYRTRKFELPMIQNNLDDVKQFYIRQRVADTKFDVSLIPNLVLDLNEFIRINNIESVLLESISNDTIQYLHRNHVIFLSHNHTTLYCRSVRSDEGSDIRFKKIKLQTDPLDMLDFWSITGSDIDTDTVILAEGNFNILNEYKYDYTSQRSKCRVYASGNGFNYDSLLKSVCYSFDIYHPKVVILSDDDKNIWAYKNFLKTSKDITNLLTIYKNQSGKDFGDHPIRPIRIDYTSVIKSIEFEKMKKK